MKKQLLFLILILFQLNSFSQAPAIQWQKCLGGTSYEIANCIRQTTDSGYIVAGVASSTNGDLTFSHGNYEAWVVKLSNLGEIQWQKTYGGADNDEAYDIQQTSDGGYIVAGYTLSINGDVTTTNHGSYDAWVIKLSNLGDIQWQKTYGGITQDWFRSIKQTIDGGYIMAGSTLSNDGDVSGNNGYRDVWVVKINNSGDILWQNCFGGIGTEEANEIQQTLDGGYIMAGYASSNDGDVLGNQGEEDCWIVKMSNLGEIQWQKSLGGNSHDYATSIQQTSEGGYIISGHVQSYDGDVTNNHGGTDIFVAKLNSIGVLDWANTLGSSFNDVAMSIQQTVDGGYIVAGESGIDDGDVTINQGSSDAWVVKLSNLGILQWQKAMGGIYSETVNSIKQTMDGGYIMAGYTSSNNNGNVSGFHGLFDYWVVKLAPDPLSDETFTKNDLILFPNPTNSILNLQFQNAIKIDKVIITEITGKKIIEQTNDNSKINVESLAKGTYIIKAYSANKKFQNKFIKK